jgi:hypothetical protein
MGLDRGLGDVGFHATAFRGRVHAPHTVHDGAGEEQQQDRLVLNFCINFCINFHECFNITNKDHAV